MTLQEEKIQDDRIRGTPEIDRRGTVPQVRPSAMPRFDHEHRKPVAYGTPAQRSKQAEPRRQLLVVDLTGTIRHVELRLSLCRLDCRGEVSMS